jgi:hypothetical protein
MLIFGEGKTYFCISKDDLPDEGLCDLSHACSMASFAVSLFLGIGAISE